MTGLKGYLSSIRDNDRIALLCGAAVLGGSVLLGSMALASGLVRMQRTDREVTVRGVAQRDVQANRATWRVRYSSSNYVLSEALAQVDQDTLKIRKFLADQGFNGATTAPGSADISTTSETVDEKPTGRTIYTVSRTISFTTDNVAGVQKIEANKDRLALQGLVVDSVEASYEYTQLDKIKPEMIGQATKDARAAAETFADDSGSSVGGIRSATQGYFTVARRDETSSTSDEYGSGNSTASSPDQKVRVVTTIVYYLD
mgnify:CR=1 FL=1